MKLGFERHETRDLFMYFAMQILLLACVACVATNSAALPEGSVEGWSAIVDDEHRNDTFVHAETGRVAILSMPYLRSRKFHAGEDFLLDKGQFSEPVSLTSLDYQHRRWGSALSILDDTTGALVPIELPNELWVSDVAWSPSGRWLSFLATDGERASVWLASADGSEVFELSDVEPNLLVEGEISSILGTGPFRRSLAYRWSEDETGIFFVARDEDVRLSGLDWLFLEPPRSRDETVSAGWSVRRQLAYNQEIDESRFVADKLFAGKLAFASIETRKTHILSSEATSIRKITHASRDGGVRVATESVTVEGKPQREIYVVSLDHQSHDRLISKSVVPGEVIGSFFNSTSETGSAIVQTSGGGEECLVLLTSETDERDEERCFKKPIEQIVDYKNDLLVRTSEGAVHRVLKRDLSVIGSLQIDLAEDQRLELMQPLSGACNSGARSSALVKPVFTGVTSDIVQMNARFSALDELVQLDFSKGEVSRVDLGGSAYRDLAPTSFALCNGDPVFVSESTRDPVNFHLVDIVKNQTRQLTTFKDPNPEFLDLERVDLEFERADGVPLAARIILPENDSRAVDGKYPAIIWQYPSVYASLKDWIERRSPVETLSQLDSELAAGGYARPQTSRQIATWLPYLLSYDGYAVIAYPHFPYLGEDGGGYGTFSDQRIANAKAIIAESERTGFIDTDRVAIGGQSRGGTEAMMLLAETDVFAAGISTSGPTTFTNMPLGFQFESRAFDDAQDSYLRNSPMLNVERIDEPLLMIHGQRDQQPYYQQAAYLYYALRQLDRKAKVLVYPGENHELSGSWEHQIHILTEVSDWLERHMSIAK